MFKIGDYAILNEKVQSGLPSHVGELVTIYATANHSPNYDYTIMFENGDLNPVKESELNVLTEKQKELITYIRKNNKVTYIPTGEIVKILKVDYLYGQVEIEHEDQSQQVVLYTTLKQLEEESWGIVEQPEESLETVQEEMLHMFFSQYKNNDDTYTVPKIVLVNMLTRLYEEVK